jgi:hypothetical protein
MRGHKLCYGLLVVVLLAATPWGLVQIGAAQTGPVTLETPVNTSRVSPAGQTPSGPQEGMGIHGHWTVTVRNADGIVASRKEFDNSVTNLGKGIVLSFLSGSPYPMQGYVPVWELKVSENLCGQHTPPIRKTPGDCLIPVKAELVIGGKVEMKGTVAIEFAGQIKSVATQITNTVNSTSSPVVFSSRDLTQPDSASGQAAGPINVQPGQNVDFTVDINIS